MVFDLLANPSTQPLVRTIFVSVEDCEKDYGDRLSSLTSAQLQLVTPEVMKALSDTVTPQGNFHCILGKQTGEFY
jgi:hypothetical protein